MKILESTGVYTQDGTQVAVRSFKNGGPRVTMLVNKDEWEQVKDLRAFPENNPSMVATAGAIIDDWEKAGAEIYWQTAADYNRNAREMENNRFRNHPDLTGHFDANIDNARNNAKATTRNTLRAVESMTFKYYLLMEEDTDNTPGY